MQRQVNRADLGKWWMTSFVFAEKRSHAPRYNPRKVHCHLHTIDSHLETQEFCPAATARSWKRAGCSAAWPTRQRETSSPGRRASRRPAGAGWSPACSWWSPWRRPIGSSAGKIQSRPSLGWDLGSPAFIGRALLVMWTRLVLGNRVANELYSGIATGIH